MKVQKLKFDSGLRIPKKCPVCGSFKFGVAGRDNSKIRLGCPSCHFESFIKKFPFPLSI